LNSSPNIVKVFKPRRMRWAVNVVRMENTRYPYKILIGEPEGKRPCGRPTRRLEDNVKMHLKEI
jgi:hypothetical protein